MASRRRDYGQPRRWLLPAVGLFIIVVAAVAVWALTRHQDQPSRAPEASAAPSPSPSGAASTSICGLPDGPQAVPHTAPSAEWKLEDAFAYPTSTQFGPGREQGNVHSCYAHNPTGALFAAVGYVSDGAQVHVDRDAQLDRVLNDANKDTIVEQTRRLVSQAGSAQQISAFRVDDATTSRVHLELVLRVTEGPKVGGFVAIPITMAWHNGDWLYVVSNGGGSPPLSQVTSLAQYVKWSGA